jgi:hypothetical protein
MSPVTLFCDQGHFNWIPKVGLCKRRVDMIIFLFIIGFGVAAVFCLPLAESIANSTQRRP